MNRQLTDSVVTAVGKILSVNVFWLSLCCFHIFCLVAACPGSSKGTVGMSLHQKHTLLSNRVVNVVNNYKYLAH